MLLKIIKKSKLKMFFISLILLTAFLTCFINLHSFLALNRPIATNTLVIEGWLFDYMLDYAVNEINQCDYQYIITVGCKKKFKQSSVHYGYSSYADYVADKIIKKGIDSTKVFSVPFENIYIHQTYQSAISLKKWLKENKNLDISSVNVFTGGPHARKSYVIFKKNLKDICNIGIISCQIKHYNSRFWWSSIRGLKVTLRYFWGYIYALLFYN